MNDDRMVSQFIERYRREKQIEPYAVLALIAFGILLLFVGIK